MAHAAVAATVEAAAGARAVSLREFNPAETDGVSRQRALRQFEATKTELLGLQERLYAERRRSVLVVLQGMDTSGKDGTISHVMSGLNAQGIRLTAFKAPTPVELRHDFLWRIRKALPGPGQIGIFNRSQYEDVLIVRVDHLAPPEEVERRYGAINDFETNLVRSGTAVVKCCLVISSQEQRKRLVARLEDPTKRWKYSPDDVDKRAQWDVYQAAYQIALDRCSTPEAPWHVIPADHKWYRNHVVSRLLLKALRAIDPQYPAPSFDVKRELERLRPH